MRKLFVSILSLCIAFTYYTPNKVLFSGVEGEYTFYTLSKSSCAKIITVDGSLAESTLNDLTDVTGQSVSFKSDGVKVNAIIEKYSANAVFTEYVCGISNTYYYSTDIKDYVIIGGKRVNLHVAEGKEITTVGSPIIFGGY